MPRGGAKKGERRGGRKRGTPNRITSDVRQAFAKLIEGAVPKLEAWLESVGESDPARALTIIKDLAEYHIPKLSRAELAGDGGGSLKIEIVKYGNDSPAA